jgi:hypothetical protein
VGFMKSLVGMIGSPDRYGISDYEESLTVDKTVSGTHGSYLSLGKKD